MRAYAHVRNLSSPEALIPYIEEGAVNQPTNPPLAFPGLGLARIWQINSPYHTNINRYITSSSVDTLIPSSGKVALATHKNSFSDFWIWELNTDVWPL